MNQESFITAAFDSLQIVLHRVLNRRLSLDLEVLQWSKISRKLSAQNETNNNPPTESLHSTAASSYNSSQVNTAREIEESS